MNQEVVRAILDSIITEVKALGNNSDNGPDLTLAEVKSWNILSKHYRGDEITAFQSPWPSGWQTRLMTIELAQDRHSSIDVTFDPATKAVYSIESRQYSGQSMQWMWGSDNGYLDWLTFAQQQWTKQREFDVRHLTDDEFECLQAITDAIVAQHPGTSTHITYHARMTQDQLLAALVRRMRPMADPNDRHAYSPYHTPWLRFDDPHRDDSFQDIFRRLAPTEVVQGAGRILEIFDRLDIKRVDLQEVRKRREAAYTWEVPESPVKQAHVLTVDSSGREEGYQGGWPLRVYSTDGAARLAKEQADKLLVAFNDGTDLDGVENAAKLLYVMFPRLKRENMLNEYTSFDVTTVEAD